MTKRKANEKQIDGGISAAMSSLHFEGERSARGITLTVSGIIGISDFSENGIYMKSRGGRIAVLGRRLVLNVLENKTVEIVGRIEGIEMKYGKN